MKKIITISIVIIGAITILLFSNARQDTGATQVIFTQLPVDTEDLHSVFPNQSRITSIQLSDPESSYTILTTDFASARAPQTSFDGQRLIFSAQKEEGQLWQIYEMELASRKTRQVTFQEDNCTDPAYLPDGSIIFSSEQSDPVAGHQFALYKIFPSGNVDRLTHQPHYDLLSTVSRDGRIITVSSQVFPEKTNAKLLALRPDGTKVSLYYQSPENMAPFSRGYETMDNKFVFVEKGVTNDLISISLNRPLSSREILYSGNERGGFHSAYPYLSDSLIVSYRGENSDLYSISIFNSKSRSLGLVLFSDTEYHALEPVLNIKRSVPKKLPTRVDPTIDTGKMLCMNSNITDLDPEMDVSPHKMRINTLDRVLGHVEVEEDGSFYIEVDADTPIRFQALDISGNEILPPSSWLWVRPNESKGCVGCHADRELSPSNRVPNAINNGAVFVSSSNEQEVAE
jgi:hypothetical protein